MFRKRISNILAGLTTAVLTFGIAVAAQAFPCAINLIPCADQIGSKNLRFSYESEGYKSPYDKPYSEYIYTQYGINDKTEVGVDFYNIDGSNDKYYNAKYSLFSETAKVPAVAVGAMYISDVTKPSYYAVGCKTLKELRVHFGAQTQGGDSWALLGADKKIGKSLTLLADYQSGIGHYHTVGLYWQTNSSLAVTLYYARNNTEALRDSTNYVGLNFGYMLPLNY